MLESERVQTTLIVWLHICPNPTVLQSPGWKELAALQPGLQHGDVPVGWPQPRWVTVVMEMCDTNPTVHWDMRAGQR